jgi:DNA-binding transcriptional LysR family regulator
MSGVDSISIIVLAPCGGVDSAFPTHDQLYDRCDIHIEWIWQMELRHLRYFVAVAEEKHVTRAAERLGMQQPPLSQQIRALERELDVQLFRRKPRGVELTDAGGALLADARAILAHIDLAFATTKRTARGEQGQIFVGFTSSAPFHPFVPRIIRAYRDAFPRVSLRLDESGTTELIDHLRNEQIDAAFIRTAIASQAGLVVNPLLQEAMVLALPNSHPLVRRASADASVALKALADETFIAYRRHSGPGLYDAILSACTAAGFSPRVGQEAPRIVSTLNLVAAGLGISIVPESLQRMRMDGVVYRRLAGVQPRAPLYLASRRGETSAAVQKFLNLVKRTAKSA